MGGVVLTEFVDNTIYRGGSKMGFKDGNNEVSVALARLVDELVAKDQFCGAVLVAKGEVVIFEGAVGEANREMGVVNDVDTKFNLGSGSKMFTAVAIAQLVEKGLLAFEDTIDKFLPDFPKATGEKITIAHLLTHTAGLGNIFTPEYMERKDEIETVAEFMAFVKDQPMAFEPGEKHEYSNAGFIVLGAVIEAVSKMDYFDYVAEYITKPLGMAGTGFYKKTDDVSNLARGYTKGGGPFMMKGPRPKDGNAGEEAPKPKKIMGMPTDADISVSEAKEDNFFFLGLRGSSAGGGYSTVRDMHQFSLGLQNGVLVSKEMFAILTEGKVDVSFPMKGKYAYGFVDKLENERRIVGHGGGAPGISAGFNIMPDEGYTIVVMANFDMGVFIAEREMLRIVAAAK